MGADPRAMELRDQGQLDEAVELPEQLGGRLGPEDKHLSAHSHIQVGHIRKKQERFNDSERHLPRREPRRPPG